MIKQIQRISLTFCLLILCCSPAGYGQSSTSDALLVVAGDVERPLKFAASDLAKLPRRSVRAKDHSGKESVFEGVLLIDLLRPAGVKFGEELRGKALTAYLVVEAADGYKVVFALAELDPAFTDQVVLLADRRDGNSLSATEGPLRIVIPDEKRQARWVRQVTALMIRRAQ